MWAQSVAATAMTPLDDSGLFRSICDELPYPVWVTDADGRYVYVNRAGARTAGMTAADMIGRTDAMLSPPEDYAGIRSRDESVLATGVPRTDEVTGVFAGRLRTCLSTRLPWRGKDGAILGVIGIMRDITEERALERAHRDRDRLRAVGALAGGVAHNLNNILAIIELGCSACGPASADEDDWQQISADVHQAVRRAAQLSDQLLAIGGRQVIRVVALDLADVVSSAIRDAAGTGDGAVQIVTEGGTCGVKGDREHLHQILRTLLAYAATTAGERRLVTVAWRRAPLSGANENQVAVTVRHHGMPLAPRAQQSLFDPFGSRLDDNLALPAAYGLCTLMGWQLSVRTIDSDTLFELVLGPTRE
jgi:PAS domain S-box-containing protein